MSPTLRPALAILLAAALSACGNGEPTAPAQPNLLIGDPVTLADTVRQLTAGRGIGPLARPAPVRPALVELGRALAFDKILSGNKDIACMTCHLPRFATGDDRSLSIGQGGSGLGPARPCPEVGSARCHSWVSLVNAVEALQRAPERGDNELAALGPCPSG
jgi:cytochrome c peroxidase